MSKAINRLFATVNMIIFLFAPTHSLAQKSDDKETNWYQVEVFIFANEARESAQGEQWPSDLRLRYPANSVQLNGPKATPSSGTDDSSSAALSTADDSNLEPSVTAALPVAFELLPAEQYKLTEQIIALTKQNDFRPLFHGAWFQTMADRENSIAVVIRGGDQFDDHFELEGTIKLSVERYLHVQTDLWLSRFINAAASDEPNWNTLPKVPVQELYKTKATKDFFIDTSQTLQFLDQQDSFGFIEQRQYRVEKTVVMRQDRRMRSSELHYIDHPLFGALVKVTPYEVAFVTPPEAEPALEPVAE